MPAGNAQEWLLRITYLPSHNIPKYHLIEDSAGASLGVLPECDIWHSPRGSLRSSNFASSAVATERAALKVGVLMSLQPLLVKGLNFALAGLVLHLFQKTLLLHQTDLYLFFKEVKSSSASGRCLTLSHQQCSKAWGQELAGAMKSIFQILELTYLNPCSCFSAACAKPSYGQIHFPRTRTAPSYCRFTITNLFYILVTILCLDHTFTLE